MYEISKECRFLGLHKGVPISIPHSIFSFSEFQSLIVSGEKRKDIFQEIHVLVAFLAIDIA
jgi:hypothetical protein